MSFSIYNPVNSTHRGRVIEAKTLRYQLEQAKLQATEKLDHLVTNLVAGTTARGTVVLKDGVISKIEMTSYGTGYTTATIGITAASGTGASATANMDSNGAIQAITVDNGGEGYPIVAGEITITITGDGTRATASATAYNGVITDVVITNKGSNYKFPPLVSFNTPAGATIDAIAVAVLTNEEVGSITITNGGSGYVVPSFVEILLPDTLPTLAQRTLLYDAYYQDFVGKVTKPIDIVNAQYNQGKLVQAEKTTSFSTITNPIVDYGNRDVQRRIPPPKILDVAGPDNPSECYFSIHNDGKLPSQEYLFTHNRRIDRNDNTNHLLAKANEIVTKQVEAIVATGGRGAVLKVETIVGGAITAIIPTAGGGGLYYTTNPPTITITRMQSDPGRAQATVTIGVDGKISTVTITNHTTNLGYSTSHPPKFSIAGNAIIEIKDTDISAGRVVTATIVDKGSGYARNFQPLVTIDRIADDPGLALAVVATVVTTNTLDHGKILTITVTRQGLGYNINYPPIVQVFNGVGSVSPVQKVELLKDALFGAFDHLVPNWGEKVPPITTTLNIKGSSSIITKNRSLYVVDVDDPLLRGQRLDYKDSDIVRDSKAKEAALARYAKAVENGTIPDEPAIPTDPVLPTATITSTTGSGGIFKVIVNRKLGASISGQVSGIEVIDGGSGYPASPANVSITGGGLSAYGAMAYPEITNGSVVDLHLIFGGYDYTVIPAVTISGGDGGAFYQATINADFEVSGFTQFNSGADYMSVEITGGGGSGAKALVYSQNGVITGFSVTDSGSGYNLQQPPNPHYLEYLKEAEMTPVERAKIEDGIADPSGRLPPDAEPKEDELPEPTLEPSKDSRGFLDNLSVENRNQQRSYVRRAGSSVIEIAQIARKFAYDEWLSYKNQSGVPPATLLEAFTATVIASKASTAATELKKWRPPTKDPYMAHKTEVFSLYRATIPIWNPLTTYAFNDLVNYTVDDRIYKVLVPHRPADTPQTPLGIWLVNPITYLGIYYQLNQIKP